MLPAFFLDRTDGSGNQDMVKALLAGSADPNNIPVREQTGFLNQCLIVGASGLTICLQATLSLVKIEIELTCYYGSIGGVVPGSGGRSKKKTSRRSRMDLTSRSYGETDVGIEPQVSLIIPSGLA